MIVKRSDDGEMIEITIAPGEAFGLFEQLTVLTQRQWADETGESLEAEATNSPIAFLCKSLRREVYDLFMGVGNATEEQSSYRGPSEVQ